MSYSVYPDAPIKLKNKETRKLFRKFFPGIEDDIEDAKKSIEIKAKVLPGLKRDNSDTQKFNLRDIIINIIRKGFTTEDSIETVNDALTRFKMGINKKSPFKDTNYDDYVKQVEDEVLAHIVQGDEFRNIGKISDFLYLGNESELIGDGAYDKDNTLRSYLTEINKLLKDEKFILKNHSENHNTDQAIMSSIFLLKQYIKEYRKKDPSSDSSDEVIGVTAENVVLEKLTEDLQNIFDNHLSFFFEKKKEKIYLKDNYLNLRDYINQENDFQSFLFDNFSIGSSTSYSYVVVLDEDIEGGETAIYEIQDNIYNSMKRHFSKIEEMNEFFKINTKCANKKKNLKTSLSDSLSEVENPHTNSELNIDLSILNENNSKDITKLILLYLNQIRHFLECILEESDDFKKQLMFNFKEFDDIFNDGIYNLNKDDIKLKDCLGLINLSIIEMFKIYNILNKFKISLDNPGKNTDGTTKPLNRYQVSKKISKMSDLKDNYDELESNIRIDFKLYNKRYMLNVQSGIDNSILNNEYNQKLEKYKIYKNNLDKRLYDESRPGHLKDEFIPNSVRLSPTAVINSP